MLPIYNEYFPVAGNPPADWGPFKTHPGSVDVVAPTQIDFSVSDPQAQNVCWETAKKIALFLLKVVIFPWGLYEGVKYLVGRIFMNIVYPAQTMFSAASLDAIRRRVASLCCQGGYVMRSVVLEKNGVRYSGLILGSSENISNGKWAIQAVGNASVIERLLEDPQFLNAFMEPEYNLLLINGPGVGRSEGPAAPNSIGDAQEVGISLLEAMNARRIVLSGHSLGGAAISRAVLQHEFREDIDYCVIRTFTFDTLSHIAGEIAGCVGRGLVHWLDYEMDNVEASRKLQELHIRDISFKGGSDALMRGVHLVDALEQTPDLVDRMTYNVLGAGHNSMPWGLVQNAITSWEQSLVLAPQQVVSRG